MQCSKCGTENAASTKFCTECGTPTLAAQSPAVAERRQLTVFFIDLVGASTLSETLDPEELRELYAQYQKICGDVIAEYEGHVAQYLGDGILAYFGYPTAHEDDAVRAVQSALDVLQGLREIDLHGERPSVRIGIHTGLVVIGEVGSGQRREQLALGEAPNIAARVQSLAEPDTVLITDATRRLVAGHFAFDDFGPRTLKGISRPMQLFRVTGRSGTSRFEALTAAGLAPFVGREREAGAIRVLWGKAATGDGHAVLLRGEAGIGKSRLLGVAKSAAEDDPHELFEAQCSPYKVNHALHPITEMIERRLGLALDLPAEEKLDLLEQFVAGRGVRLEEAVPLLAALFSIPVGDRYPASDLPPAKRRQRTLEILADVLLHAPGGKPVLALVEDLHWADPSTLELVASIVARQANAPLMLLCTTRPEGVVSWPEGNHWHEIRVLAFQKDDTRALIAGVVGRKRLPDEVTQQIISRTGGIPLFVEAVTRTVIETGVLRELDDRYELSGPLPEGLIPATVHDSLMARIDRLGSDKAVAQLASTIGREFSFELLQAVSGKSADALAISLGRLVELDLVSQADAPPDAIYTFKHALIQDSAYESLLRKTRQEFHGRIAEALATHFPALVESQPELLGRHYEGAGRINEAIGYWLKAGLQAQQRSAEAECVAYLRKTIALLETLPADDPNRVRDEMTAQLALGPALMATQGWGSREVEAACSRARDLCQQAQNGQGLLAALWGLWTVRFVRGEIRPALEAAEPVLNMALATDDPILHIVAHHGVGFTRYFAGEFQAARDHGEKALALFDLDRERALVSVFQLPSSVACGIFLSQSLWFMGYPEQARRRHTDAWALVTALSNAPSTAYGLGVGMWLHYAERDLDAVGRRAEEMAAISAEEGFLLWGAQARIYRGWVQSMNGNTAAGLDEMRAGMESYAATGSGIQGPQLWVMLAEAMRAAGRPGEALAALSTGMRISTELHERAFEPELYRIKGEIQIDEGASSAGEASLRRAIDIAQGQQARMLELRAARSLARLQREQGRVDEARALLQPLHDWFTEGEDTCDLRETRALIAELQA